MFRNWFKSESLPDSSISKESTCNAGDPSSISFRVGKIRWGRDRLPTPVLLDFPCGSAGKESVCNARNLDLISGLGRSPGEGKGYLLQYSGLENSMNVLSMGWQRVRHDWVTMTFAHVAMPIGCYRAISGHTGVGTQRGIFVYFSM